ncbi:MAG: transposase [Candidatus Vogelbacteria bacterium]|nr:transposase [Candidatus Vogelbacteria bacterium]
MARPEFIDGGIYHIYNRGTDKRDIFLDDQDYFRFIHYLYACNDVEPLEKIENLIIGDPISGIRGRERLVSIFCYALLPNHFHLLIQQRKEGGVSKFMQKLSIGYTMYFNVRNERTGVLFQGKFKSKFVDDEKYLETLVNYIHLNPLDIFQKKWKENGVKDYASAKNFLEEYRWSSYLDYIGKKNLPSLLDFVAIKENLGDTIEHKDTLNHLLKDYGDGIAGLLLD